MVSSIDLITTRPGKTLEVRARATASLDQSGELKRARAHDHLAALAPAVVASPPSFVTMEGKRAAPLASSSLHS